jgi:8-oxo-dGTP pyrophosphatase MutT (NUDIX family)
MKSAVDYNDNDYRGFIFVVHDKYGLLLLHCTRKKNKPPHWQIPGGHIDDPEFLRAGEFSSSILDDFCKVTKRHRVPQQAIHVLLAAKASKDRATQLIAAAKQGAARELMEETGIDIRQQLDRLELAVLRTAAEIDKNGNELLSNEYKHRVFFTLNVTDDDFSLDGVDPLDCSALLKVMIARFFSLLSCNPGHFSAYYLLTPTAALQLNLSVEHSGFTFETEPRKAAEMVQLHSGGKLAEALLMSMNKGNPVASKKVRMLSPRKCERMVSPRKREAMSSVEKELDWKPITPQRPLTGSKAPASSRRKKTDKYTFEETVPSIELFPEPKRKSLTSCWGFC